MTTTPPATVMATDRGGNTTTTRGQGLQIRGLRKTLGGRDIVAGIDLDVAKGELVSLLGPSGCGKTTTLRMVAGFLDADSGSIRMGEADVTALGPERRPSAMVFQNYALWPHMTVQQNVAFPLRTRRVDRTVADQRVDAALQLVNLTHHARSKPTAISGGEQQRVALARAIVQEPDVLLLDEPLSNLDAKLRVEVRDEIRRIQQRLGITTVIVTHDQDEALSVSDRIAVMHDGRIEQVAAPATLYASPATRFVASFIGSTSALDGSARGLIDDALLTRSDVDGGLRDGDEVLVRPESVHIVAPTEGRLMRVERVLMRGHFSEVVLDDGLHAFVGRPPEVGSVVGVRVDRVLVYRDGLLVGGAS
ncbi:ABC transporter ATP-binding protein [Curtobacterium ammoniigenes]|uniref:ABC transporter ATP-binding protein n=1 Tax=Curtobacterium ammoniigenes TaxID=395387 RepID=UPI0009FADD42|nr:ABC transporter ATP-binding protein [Curtobacterium ammoniigenes]